LISRLVLALRPGFAAPWRGPALPRSIGWIDENGHSSGRGHQLTQEFQPLRRQLSTVKIHAGRVAARPSKAGDKTKLDRIFGGWPTPVRLETRAPVLADPMRSCSEADWR
jgi:hypothetical protein